MFGKAKFLYLGSAMATVGLLVAGAFLMLRHPSEAEAQTGVIEGGTNVTVNYSSAYINRIVASKRDDRIREVIPFPNAPVFLVRTGEAVTVWLREDRGLKMLQQIDLPAAFEDIQFLDDNRTFIIRTRENVRVFSLDRQIVRTPEQVSTRRR